MRSVEGGSCRTILRMLPILPLPPIITIAPAPLATRAANLAVALGASDGRLTLSWKVQNPAGTSGTAYTIRRRLRGEPGFSYVGVTGKKTFVDDTVVWGAGVREVPMCIGIAPAVQYTVHRVSAPTPAARSARSSP